MAAHARSAKGLQFSGMSTLKGFGPSPASSLANSLSSKSTFQKPFDTAYHQLQKQRDLEFIKSLFSDCDADHSGYIDEKEFTDCMNHPRTFRIFQQRFGVQKHQTAMVFAAFDIDGDRTICLKEFLETCTFLMQVVKDGQVVTNWRQKELRTLKETWPTQLEPLGSIKRNISEPSLARAVIAPARGGKARAS
jgi:Ca2+-binding EF-hand superfamily protein